MSTNEGLNPVSQEQSGDVVTRGGRIGRILNRIFKPDRDKVPEYLVRLRRIEARRREIIEELQRKYPDDPYSALDVVAYERTDLEELCKSLNALPLQGASRKELTDLGFRLYNETCDGRVFRPVVFPRGWTMEPATAEPEIAQSGNAGVFDESGGKRIHVLYRIDASSGFPSARSYTRIVTSDHAENSYDAVDIAS
jgi:hypothetical protein